MATVDTVQTSIIAPGDSRWDAHRGTFNLTIDQQPTAIAAPAYEAEVAAAIGYGRERGLRVAPQRTGHNAAPLGSLDDTLLVRTDALQGVEIDADARRARVRSGARWEDVVPHASDIGLAALHGSTPDVSIAGYSLGGGLGWYARKHGLATNSVIAIEIVTADGRLRRVDQDHEPELFWALRGGGGNFGVVTALEFALYPIPEVYAGVLFFPWERSSDVLHAWHEWLPGLPDEATTVGRIMQFPPFPDVPEPLRGGSFALVEMAFVGTEADGASLLEPLRSLGPALDTFAMVPPVGLAELHMDPQEPVPYVLDHQLLGDLPAKAIDDLVAVAGAESGSSLLSFELRHTGGALARSAPGHGALDRLRGAFASMGIGLDVDAEMAAANRARMAMIHDALAPYDVGRYSNFTEEQGAVERFFSPETYRRLQAVKAQYDPENVFRANHPIPQER